MLNGCLAKYQQWISIVVIELNFQISHDTFDVWFSTAAWERVDNLLVAGLTEKVVEWERIPSFFNWIWRMISLQKVTMSGLQSSSTDIELESSNRLKIAPE